MVFDPGQKWHCWSINTFWPPLCWRCTVAHAPLIWCMCLAQGDFLHLSLLPRVPAPKKALLILSAPHLSSYLSQISLKWPCNSECETETAFKVVCISAKRPCNGAIKEMLYPWASSTLISRSFYLFFGHSLFLLSLCTGTLMILKSACSYNSSYIDRLISVFMRSLQKMVREHLSPQTNPGATETSAGKQPRSLQAK